MYLLKKKWLLLAWEVISIEEITLWEKKLHKIIVIDSDNKKYTTWPVIDIANDIIWKKVEIYVDTHKPENCILNKIID